MSIGTFREWLREGELNEASASSIHNRNLKSAADKEAAAEY